MKKFLIGFARLVLVLVIVVVIDFAVGKLDRFVFKHENLSTPDYITTVSQCDDDIIIIGSSTAHHHYIPQRIQDSLGMSVYNAGMDGAFFIFQNCVIHHLLDSVTPNYIIWEIGEDCLSDNMAHTREYQKMDLLYPYYSDEYIHNAIDNYDLWQKYRMMSRMFCDNSNIIHDVLVSINLIRHGKLTAKKTEDLKRGYSPLPNTGYSFPEKKCDSVAEYINPEKREMLLQTIKECKQHGVQIIFTSSPRYYDADLLSLKQVKELKRIAQEKDIPYMDFYRFDGISTDSTYFKDCDHLNARGAEAYMDVFIPALNLVINDLKAGPSKTRELKN